VLPEGLCKQEIPIEPATFRLVAQCLNKLRHRMPLVLSDTSNKLAKSRVKYSSGSAGVNKKFRLLFRPTLLIFFIKKDI